MLHVSRFSRECSGIWLTSVAAENPSVDCVGIDVSPYLWPAHYPPNASFEKHSVTSLPADWSDRFSFVHQRYLMGSLTLSDWRVALQEHLRVLRPGGCAQLLEVIPVLGSGPAETKLGDLRRRVAESRSLHMMHVAKELGGLMSEAGFEGVVETRRLLPLGEERGGVDGGEAGV